MAPRQLLLPGMATIALKAVTLLKNSAVITYTQTTERRRDWPGDPVFFPFTEHPVPAFIAFHTYLL